MAIEFCEIFVISENNFKKYFAANEAILKKLTKTAESRMKRTLKAEEDFQMKLREFERESFMDTKTRISF